MKKHNDGGIVPETSLKWIVYEIWEMDTELSIATSKDYPYGLGKEWKEWKETK